MGLRFVSRLVLRSLSLFFFLVYAPFLLDFSPLSFDIPLVKLEGALAPNDALSSATHLFEGIINGPESVAFLNGYVYTGLSDGRIVRFKGNNLETIARLNNETICGNLWDMKTCGRPLTVRFDARGNLYALDAYFGIRSVNISTGEVTSVLDTRPGLLAGRKVVFLDDMVIDQGAGASGGHVFYLTDASAKWEVEYVNYLVMEHESSGRILRFDADTSEVSVLADGLGFPNGIEISDDRQWLVFCELNERRLIRLHLRGARQGTREVFAEHLPGEPDNIRRSASSRQTFWVGLYEGKDEAHLDPLLDYLRTTPSLRKALIRISYHVGQALFTLGEFTSIEPLKELGFAMRTSTVYQKLYKPYGLVVEVDSDGQMIRSLHSPSGKTTLLSQASEVIEGNDRVLYLGSYFNDYLGRLVLDKQ